MVGGDNSGNGLLRKPPTTELVELSMYQYYIIISMSCARNVTVNLQELGQSLEID